MTEAVADLVREGRAAYDRGDAAASRRAFEHAARECPTGEVLEGLARACHLECDYAGSVEAYERAFGAYRREGDWLAAVRSARTIGWFRGWLYGDWAVYQGWMQRARSLVEQAGADSHQHAWALLAEAQAGADLEAQKRLYLEAIRHARRHRDAGLECEALSYLGVMLVLSGYVDEGMVHLDEALAAVCVGEIDDLSIVEGVFCGLFHACEHANDVVRAEQWLRAADDLVRRRGYVAISGYCRAHYGAILTAAGRWAEAEAEFEIATDIFPPEHRRIRANILCRLADLRVRQGRLEEATQLLRGFEDNEDAVRPLVKLHLARGETALAQDLLERALAGEAQPDQVEGPLLALLVDVHLALGAADDARATSERLSELARSQTGLYLKAIAAFARGKVCVAAGSGDARACLHEARSLFAQAGMPVDVARTALELARAVAVDRPQVAIAEATSALAAFERLHATRDADAAHALLRELGAPTRSMGKGRAGLTARESEVLDLLGHGLTNAEIGDRLFISPKTVEHHVGHILGKLGLRSRTEAAAYAIRTSAPEDGPRKRPSD